MNKKQRLNRFIKRVALIEAKGYDVPIFQDNNINRRIMNLADKFIWMKKHPNKKRNKQGDFREDDWL